MTLGLCLVLLGSWTKATGQTADAEHLSIGQAVQEAIDKNLGLLAERYNISIADARIITARLRPNPVLSIEAGHLNFLVPNGNPTGAGPNEYAFHTDFLIERGRKRENRIEVAQQARAVVELQLLNTIRLLVIDVQSAAVDVLQTKANLDLANENLKFFNGIVQINEVRVRAGDLAPVELMRTKLTGLQLRNAVIQAQLELRSARTKLQLLIGRTKESPDFEVIGTLRRDTELLSVETLQQAALQLRPDVQALVRDQARSAAEVRSQIAQGKVDYTIGVEYLRQQKPSFGNLLGFSFSVPLPVFNRNQGEIERARQEQQQVDARLKALEAEVRNQVQMAYQQYMTSRQLLEDVETDMLQQAREVRQTMEYSYRRGEASFVDFLDAQRTFNDTMQNYNTARADYARSLYQLDSVAGRTKAP
jgi:cobalt-zinc-cadmium efflux system outer membrane protein